MNSRVLVNQPVVDPATGMLTLYGLSLFDALEAATSPVPVMTSDGWAVFNDGGGAQSLAADTPATFTVAGGPTIQTHAPDGVTFWDSNKITGRNGDAIIIKVQCVFTPDDAVASTLDFSVDIGGAVGVVEYQNFPITKGAGVAHNIAWTFLAYTLDTWQTNGGTVIAESDGPGDLTDKRVLIARVYEA